MPTHVPACVRNLDAAPALLLHVATSVSGNHAQLLLPLLCNPPLRDYCGHCHSVRKSCTSAIATVAHSTSQYFAMSVLALPCLWMHRGNRRRSDPQTQLAERQRDNHAGKTSCGCKGNARSSNATLQPHAHMLSLQQSWGHWATTLDLDNKKMIFSGGQWPAMPWILVLNRRPIGKTNKMSLQHARVVQGRSYTAIA